MNSPTFQEMIAASAAAIQSTSALEPQVESAATLLSKSFLGGGRLFCCGNGGSGADASHMAAEFAIRFLRERGAWPAFSLGADGAVVTAGGNDYGFEEVFAHQLAGMARPGDVVAVFSTSGKSRNIFRALETAKTRGIRSIAFLGRDGGVCRGMADIELLVPLTVTANIQEAHHFLMHALCEMVDAALAGGHSPASNQVN